MAISVASVSGYAYAPVLMAIDEERLEELACFTAPHDENKSVAVVNASRMTETVVENPCGIGEWLREQYKPWAGLVYGPLYLLCCSLSYWLIVVRRPALKVRRQMVLLAVGVLVVEWRLYLVIALPSSANALSPVPMTGFVTILISTPGHQQLV